MNKVFAKILFVALVATIGVLFTTSCETKVTRLLTSPPDTVQVCPDHDHPCNKH